MDRRTFISSSLGGIAAIGLPGNPLEPTSDELISSGLKYDMDATSMLVRLVGEHVDQPGPIVHRDNLLAPLALQERAIAAYEEAGRRDPGNVLHLEFLLCAQAQAASLELLAGRDPLPRLEAAIRYTRQFEPHGPGVRGAVQYVVNCARLLARIRQQGTPVVLSLDDFRHALFPNPGNDGPPSG